MSQKPRDKDDEEFYDAVSNPSSTEIPCGTQTNDEIIEELIQKQSELHLPDECDSAINEHEFHDAAVAEDEQSTLVDDDEDIAAMQECEKTMTVEELQHNKEEANTLKLEGNELFKEEKADEAIEAYNKALKLCPSTYTKERAILYGNRAAAKIKIDSKKSAIGDCTKAIELWPEYVRVIVRRAKLYESDDKLDDALVDYKRVIELDPSQDEARQAIVRLPPIINERNERMKEEMMSKLKDLGNMILKPFGLSTNNFQMQQDSNTGGYSINFKQNN